MNCRKMYGAIILIQKPILLRHIFIGLEKKFQAFLKMMSLYLVKKMVTKLNKKNPIVKDLFSKKYKPKVVKPKKGKGSFRRKKKLIKKFYLTSTLKLITIRSSSLSFFATLCGKYPGNINKSPSFTSIPATSVFNSFFFSTSG